MPLFLSTARSAAFCAVVLLSLVGQGSAGTADNVTRQEVRPKLIPVVTQGLRSPLFLTHAGDGSGQLFIVEQAGTIRIFDHGVLQEEPFLDLRDRVSTKGYEQGLLGLAFHPNHKRNGRFFVNYNRLEDGATILAEFSRRGRRLKAASAEQILMAVPQPYTNHNGGMITFGPDGFLYVGRGDGGSAGDPQNRAQNPQEWLGKILRIDVDRKRPYAAPPDNPFAKGGGQPEIFALGLRNPWRFSFDRETGALWLADVGQHKWEEIDVVTRGGNYGWRVMEGTHCYVPEKNCETVGLTLPVVEYGHENGRCSVTGGYVYRGQSIPALRGIYLFGDYCSGEVFGLSVGSGRQPAGPPSVLVQTGLRISSFGEDEAGEMYVVDHQGGVYRVGP